MTLRHLILATALSAATPSIAAEQQARLSVPGMFCASCPFLVQAAAGAVEGVLSVKTDLDRREALVVYDDDTATLDAIRAALAGAGYPATPAEPGS